MKYNRRMNRRVITGIILAGIGTVLLAAGFWPFRSVPFEVPVTLSSGEQATISGKLPATAWAGDPFSIAITFKLTSHTDATGGRLRAMVELRDAEVTPAGELTVAFNPANAITLQWRVTPLTKGTLDGTLWVYASLDPLPENALLAREFHVKAVTLLGISAAWYRRVGLGILAAGIFVGLAFSFSGKKRSAVHKKGKTVTKIKK